MVSLLLFMRLRLGDLFGIRRVTLSCSKSGMLEEEAASSSRNGYPQSTTHFILLLPLIPLFLPWVVVSEYRACLQRRMKSSQEEGTFQSPPSPDAGGKGVLPDCTPTPTPTEVSVPHRQGRACCGQVPAPSCYQLVHST